jgi:hypothetical protein
MFARNVLKLEMLAEPFASWWSREGGTPGPDGLWYVHNRVHDEQSGYGVRSRSARERTTREHTARGAAARDAAPYHQAAPTRAVSRRTIHAAPMRACARSLTLHVLPRSAPPRVAQDDERLDVASSSSHGQPRADGVADRALPRRSSFAREMRRSTAAWETYTSDTDERVGFFGSCVRTATRTPRAPLTLLSPCAFSRAAMVGASDGVVRSLTCPAGVGRRTSWRMRPTRRPPASSSPSSMGQQAACSVPSCSAGRRASPPCHERRSCRRRRLPYPTALSRVPTWRRKAWCHAHRSRRRLLQLRGPTVG